MLSGWTIVPSEAEEEAPGADGKAIAAGTRSTVGGIVGLVFLFLLLSLFAFITISPVE